MNALLGISARIVAVSGLLAISALHTGWAAGSPWPAKNDRRLAEAVIGSTAVTPGPAPTAVVAASTAGAGVLASGALGSGRLQRLCLRSFATILLARAVLGGSAALAVLRLPSPGATFRRLDRRCYRPFAALLGVALWLVSGPGSGPRTERRAALSTRPQPPADLRG